MKHKTIIFFIWLYFLNYGFLSAETQNDLITEPIQKLVSMFETGDTINIDQITTEKFIVTMFDTSTAENQNEIIKFHNKYINPPKTMFRSATSVIKLDKIVLQNEQRICATGFITETFISSHKKRPYTFENQWSALLEKKDGKWKISMLHISTSPDNNPMAKIGENMKYWWGLYGAAFGTAFSFLIFMSTGRTKKA